MSERLWHDPSVIGTGPAAQAVALSSAGVTVRSIARHLRLSGPQVAEFLFAHRVAEAERDGVRLQRDDATRCAIADCGSPTYRRGLCGGHATKVYKGRPLERRRTVRRAVRIGSCVVCGARWCVLRTGKRKYCSDRCRREVRRGHGNLDARDAAILGLVDDGLEYADIGARFGLGPGRVAQLANRSGRFRYSGRKTTPDVGGRDDDARRTREGESWT